MNEIALSLPRGSPLVPSMCSPRGRLHKDQWRCRSSNGWSPPRSRTGHLDTCRRWQWSTGWFAAPEPIRDRSDCVQELLRDPLILFVLHAFPHHSYSRKMFNFNWKHTVEVVHYKTEYNEALYSRTQGCMNYNTTLQRVVSKISWIDWRE